MQKLVLAIVLSALVAAPAAACGPKVSIPQPGADIDSLLPRAMLSRMDRAKVMDLRKQIKVLVTEGKESEARTTEEQAMHIMGYRKLWLKCGPGTFAWLKR